MHRLLLSLLITAGFFNSFSQNTTNTWVFGNRIALNFNVFPPQQISAAVPIVEGCAVMCDLNGNLLFYSNGKKIYTRDHSVMQGGDNLEGDISSTSNSVIVPLPGNSTVYFVFTIGASGKADQGFRYSIVDMAQNNGRGRVTVKNIFIEDNTYEKLAAVRHCNNKDVWITIKKWNTDEYHTYLVDETGLSSTYRTFHSGLIVSGYPNNSIGQMKFSADGKKMAAVHAFEINKVEVMNFNNATGELSSPVNFVPHTTTLAGQLTGVYGVAFSPSGELLYVSSSNNTGSQSVLYQFSLDVFTSAGIMATRNVITETSPFNAGALQEASDGRIYFSHFNDSSLSVINDPDVYGNGCNYLHRSIPFRQYGSQVVQYGLPTFISSDVNPLFAPYDFSFDIACSDLTASFRINRTSGIDSVHWYFSDGSESLLFSPIKIYPSTGRYKAKLIVFHTSCTGLNSTIEHDIIIGAEDDGNFLRGDTTMCVITPLLVSASSSATSYFWNTGSTSPSIVVDTPGLYWLELNRDGCLSRDSFQLNKAPEVTADLGPDTTVCSGKPIELIVTDPLLNYEWNVSSTGNSIQVSSAGQYSVNVRNSFGCTASDTVNVIWGDCEFLLPNAFTPNGDNLNDYFYLLNGLNAQKYRMNIYNRFGKIIFSSVNPGDKWDGTYKGKKQPAGIYVWMVVYGKEDFPQTEKGTVLLIR